MRCALVFLAGCQLYGPAEPPDAGQPVDAERAPPDAAWSGERYCGRDVPPTPDTITLAGTVTDLFTDALVAGATVDFVATTGERTSDVTDAAGRYDLAIGTGGAPVDGYFHVYRSGYADTRAHLSRSLFTGDDTFEMELVAASSYERLTELEGGTQDPTKGFVLAGVRDCMGTAIAGARLSLSEPGSAVIRYPAFSADGTTTFGTVTSSMGLALINDVEPVEQTLGGTAGITPLRDRAFVAPAGELAVVLLEP